MDKVELEDIYVSSIINTLRFQERLVLLGKSYCGLILISDDYIKELSKNDILLFEFRFLLCRHLHTSMSYGISSVEMIGDFNIDLLKYYNDILPIDIYMILDKYQVDESVANVWKNIRSDIHGFDSRRFQLELIFNLVIYNTDFTNPKDFLDHDRDFTHIKESVFRFKSFKRQSVQIPPSEEEKDEIELIKKRMKLKRNEFNMKVTPVNKYVKPKIEYDTSLDWDTFLKKLKYRDPIKERAVNFFKNKGIENMNHLKKSDDINYTLWELGKACSNTKFPLRGIRITLENVLDSME